MHKLIAMASHTQTYSFLLEKKERKNEIRFDFSRMLMAVFVRANDQAKKPYVVQQETM